MSQTVGDARARLLDNPHDRAVPPSPLRPLLQRVLVALFVLLVVIAAVFVFREHWRRGTAVLGVALMYLGVIRWLVDTRIMGVLAVRSRKFDSAFTLLTGAIIVGLAVSVDTLGS